MNRHSLPPKIAEIKIKRKIFNENSKHNLIEKKK